MRDREALPAPGRRVLADLERLARGPGVRAAPPPSALVAPGRDPPESGPGRAPGGGPLADARPGTQRAGLGARDAGRPAGARVPLPERQPPRIAPGVHGGAV